MCSSLLSSFMAPEFHHHTHCDICLHIYRTSPYGFYHGTGILHL